MQEEAEPLVDFNVAEDKVRIWCLRLEMLVGLQCMTRMEVRGKCKNT